MPTALTRQQIRSRATRLAFRQGMTSVPLTEDGVLDPFMIDEDLNAVVAELCRNDGMAYLFYQNDVAAGQARYCQAPIIEIDGATLLLSNNRGTKNLRLRTSTQMKGAIPFYLTSGATGDPFTMVIEGKSDYLLYPTPNFSLALALTVRGIGFYTDASWAADTAICPLPPDHHECVCHGLAARISQTTAIRQEEMAQYMYLKGHISSEMANIIDSARSRQADNFGGRGISGADWDPYANPLNL